jgi:inner membrane protein
MWLAVTCALMSGSRAVERRIDALAAEAFTEAVLLDRVITPMPVNPFCWEFIFVQQERDELALRRGMIALAPNWIAAGRCPGRSLDVPTTATLARVERPNDATIQWHGEARSSIADLQALWRSDCRVEAFMRYARAPYLQRTERGWVIGDLRYDREPELGFAELDLEAPAQCSSWTAPWTPPRASLAPMS